jgi:hypothetical protein
MYECKFIRITPDHLGNSWLFPQIDAALHHGGAGTTGASLKGEILYEPDYNSI